MTSDTLDEAVAEVQDISAAEILEEPYQQDGDFEWTMKIRLRPGDLNPHADIPEETDWYVRIDDTYPSGEIRIYPATKNGITQTYPHQTLNTPGDPEKPWRKGNICVDRYTHSVGRTGGFQEPFDAKNRLRWYILRAAKWLELASNGELRKEGEPFELPSFPDKSNKRKFAYIETRTSFQDWSEHSVKRGLAQMSKVKNNSVFVVVDFMDLDESSVYTPAWGDTVETENTISGIWWLLDEPPIKPPWEVPGDWEELENLLKDTEGKIFRILSEIREAYPRENFGFLLLGFPIPESIGENDAYIHWQAIEINDIPDISDFQGFRDLTSNRAQIARVSFKGEEITWIESDNWAQDQLLRRGKRDDSLRESNIMLIGAGALGSTVAENLLRDGCTNITIVDGEKFEVGNLARHTLSFNAIDRFKATALAERLRRLSPHSSIHRVTSRYPLSDDEREKIPDPDIILDCTGNDEVLYALSRNNWDTPKLVISTGLGPQGVRLYTYATYTTTFNVDDFHTQIEPWTLQDLSEHRPDEDLVPERIGCWHPASVITMNTVATWGSLVPEVIEESTGLGRGEASFTVLEKSSKKGSISIERRVDPSRNVIKWTSTDGISLELPRNCLDEMIEYFQSDTPDETGGILTGKYTDTTNGQVVRASDPPPDSIQSPEMFHRGIEEVNESLRELQERYGIYYLGEWHTHPRNTPELSEQDKREMRSIADNESYECPSPFLIIIGGDQETGFRLKPYLFHRDNDHDELVPNHVPKSDDLSVDTTTNTLVYSRGDVNYD